MCDLSENYYLRKCYLQRDEVPTQSMIRKKMSPPLAAVYFQSMHPRLRVIAGLEPSLKGGGNNWIVDPSELLKGRAVLKPIKKQALAKLNHHGVDNIGTALFQKHRKGMNKEKESVLFESDINWRISITDLCFQLSEDLGKFMLEKNTQYLSDTSNSFDYLYRTSLNNIETIFHEAAIAAIKKTRENAHNIMQNNYSVALKNQATMLYEVYAKKLEEEKDRLKAEFIQKLENIRTDMANEIHDVNVDKHMAIEQLKQFLKRQNLACEVYVALKEREECLKEIEESKYKHRKEIQTMTDNIAMKDFEIHLEKQKEKRSKEFFTTWQKKVCHIIKNFQMFVSYCINLLPDHAEFFINMEKLMLLQLNEALEDPTAESIIGVEKEEFHTPVPRPKPFYLFCDRGYKAEVDQDLCPKQSGTSYNDSYLPVIIVNKRCLYAACDNFDQFTNQIKDYIHGNRGDDKVDIIDDLTYEHFVPVKYTSSEQLLEIKLESSLLQILQQEIDYLNKVSVKCRYCQMSECVCTGVQVLESTSITRGRSNKIIPSSGPSIHKILSPVRSMEHYRELKWESYFEYVEPKKCSCSKTAKKHLVERHLPAYMKHIPRYESADMPDYEMCSVIELKALVKKAKKISHPPPVPATVEILPSKTNNITTQYYDPELEKLCSCFSDNELNRLFRDLDYVYDPTMLDTASANKTTKIDGDILSPTDMTKQAFSFAATRAYALKNLVEDLTDLQDLFKMVDCNIE